MKFNIPLTVQRPGETTDQWLARDAQAKKAKEDWHAGKAMRELLGHGAEPEPDWNTWNPLFSTSTLSPFKPLQTPPPWLQDRLPPPITWRPPQPIEVSPPGTPPEFPWWQAPATTPNPIFSEAAPAQPTVVYPDGQVEVLALRPKDVWTGLKKGGEMVLENGRWVVRVGSKVLGPVGAAGAVKDLYDFSQWVNDKLPDIEPNPPKTKYDPFTNQVLWEQPGGYWTPSPPPWNG